MLVGMRYVSESQVQQSLTQAALIPRLRQMFLDWHAGNAQNQVRRRLISPTRTMLHSMSGYWNGYLGTKFYTTSPGHPPNFTFVLFSEANGAPLAQMEANFLGQIRTGAVSGLAVDVLTARQPLRVALIGSGFQAQTQLQAIRAVRQTREVRVWSQDADRRAGFAMTHQAVAVASIEEAVDGADVIVTATSAARPVLLDEHVSNEPLIIAMGSNHADRAEVAADLVRRSKVYVDSRDACVVEAGDLLLSGVAPTRWIELAEVIGGAEPASTKGLRFFKSVGLGVEDVVAGSMVYEALRAGVGSGVTQ